MSNEERRLDICIDTESFDSILSNNVEDVNRLLLYRKNPNFNFLRSSLNSHYEMLSTICEIDTPVESRYLQVVQTIAKKALKKQRLSEGEINFLLLICIHTNLCNTKDIIRTSYDIKYKIFVTENEMFLTKRFSFESTTVSIESFFPGIKLVNLKDCLEIIDLFL